jgi:hypothetical protein
MWSEPKDGLGVAVRLPAAPALDVSANAYFFLRVFTARSPGFETKALGFSHRGVIMAHHDSTPIDTPPFRS